MIHDPDLSDPPDRRSGEGFLCLALIFAGLICDLAHQHQDNELSTVVPFNFCTKTIFAVPIFQQVRVW